MRWLGKIWLLQLFKLNDIFIRNWLAKADLWT